MKDKKVIKIACETADYIELGELIGFQGNLKTISKVNLKKLKKSIVKLGFSAPIFIWLNKNGENKIIDGHSRTKALKELRSEGWYVPKIPVVYIDASSEKQAKQKLLHITSSYGEFNVEGFNEFSNDFKKSDFSNINIDKFENVEKKKRKYEKKKKVCPHCGKEI